MSRKIIKKTLTIYKRQKPTNNLLNADFFDNKTFQKVGGIIAMGNSIADRKIKQVSEMKHLEVKENFDYYNSIIDEIQENLMKN